MYFSIDIAAAHAYQWLGPRPNLKLSRPSLQYVLQGLKVEIWWPPLLTKGVSVSVLNVAISVLHPESKLSVSSSSVSRRFCKVSVSITSPTYERVAKILLDAGGGYISRTILSVHVGWIITAVNIWDLGVSYLR